MTKLALAAKVSAFVFFSSIAATFRGMRKVDGVLTLNLTAYTRRRRTKQTADEQSGTLPLHSRSRHHEGEGFNE
jgi:hypothetical protein